MMPVSKVKIIQKIPLKTKLINKATISENAQLLTCKFGAEDIMVACGYSDGHVRIFNMNTNNKIQDLKADVEGDHHPVNSLKWRPVNQQSNITGSALLVANTDGNIYQYIAKTGKQIFHTKQEGNYIMGIDYAPDGLTFGTVGKDNIGRIYDEEAKKIKTELKGVEWHKAGHNNRLFSIKWKNNDVNLVATAGWDQNVNIWDIRQGSVISSINGPKIAGDSVDFRDDLILTGANRGVDQLQLWDWRNKKLLTTFKWDQQKTETNAFLYGCQFCKSSKNTVFAVGANQMKMFLLDDCSEMLEVKCEQGESLYGCDSSSNSPKYIIGGKKGNLMLLSGIKSHE